MPNGHTEPFRFPNPNGVVEHPSPVHTSDSEETWNDKVSYTAVQRKVWIRWRAFVSKRRRLKRVKLARKIYLAFGRKAFGRKYRVLSKKIAGYVPVTESPLN